MFAKVFSQIFDSSIAEDYVVRHIFTDLLVLADQDGVIDMTISAISRRTNVPEEIITRCIGKLMEADETSRSHLEDGRRLVLLDSHRSWGWQIVNYDHYRNVRDEDTRRTYFRDKKREYRERIKSNLSNIVQNSPTGPTLSTEGEVIREGTLNRKEQKQVPLSDDDLFGKENGHMQTTEPEFSYPPKYVPTEEEDPPPPYPKADGTREEWDNLKDWLERHCPF